MRKSGMKAGFPQSVCLSVSLPNYLLLLPLYWGSGCSLWVWFDVHMMKVGHTAVTVWVINLFFFQIQVVLDTDMCDVIPNFWKILTDTVGIKYPPHVLPDMTSCTVSHNISTAADVGSFYRSLPSLRNYACKFLSYCSSKDFSWGGRKFTWDVKPHTARKWQNWNQP